LIILILFFWSFLMQKLINSYLPFSIHLFLLTALMLLLSQKVFSNDSCVISDLPKPLQQFISDEQSFESLYVSPTQNLTRWDSPYAPSRKPSFSIKGCWLSQNQFDVLGGKVFKDENSSVVKQFFRVTERGNEVLFFVHPDQNSVEEYKKIGFDIASPDFSCVSYCATPTSSNRSLVIWSTQPNSGFEPVMVKTSLNAVLGNYVKTVSEEEAVKSFTINKLLSQQKVVDREFRDRFRFFKEPLAFSLVPRKALGTNFDRGAGVVVREIPEEIISGELHVVTAFALYGDSVSKGDIPYLLKAFQGQNRSLLDDTIKTKLIKPFAGEWLKAIIDWGLVTESHGQNLLVELDKKGLPNGRFWYRDIDGFDLELLSRQFRDLSVDNAIKGASDKDMQNSLMRKFSIFISQLQQTVDFWEKQNLIVKSEAVQIPYKTVLKNELTSQLADLAYAKYRFVLKEQLPEILPEMEWYSFFISAVLELQIMTALDSAALRGDWNKIHEAQLKFEKTGITSLVAFGFSFPEAIEFFQNLEKGNMLQEKIKAARIGNMKFQEKNPGGFEI
jgi:hypothetical protein